MLKELREWQSKGVEADLCLVGAKGIAYFRRLKVNVVAATSPPAIFLDAGRHARLFRGRGSIHAGAGRPAFRRPRDRSAPLVHAAATARVHALPKKPIRQWVLSLPFALRFLLATDPEALTRVLGIVYRTISAHVLKSARLTRASGATGAVTPIQRFGSALNLNIHFHMLVLDGAYLAGTEPPVFRRIAPPSAAELQALVERIAERIGRALERQGVLSRDAESSYLALEPDAGGAMDARRNRAACRRGAVSTLSSRPSGANRIRRCASRRKPSKTYTGCRT